MMENVVAYEIINNKIKCNYSYVYKMYEYLYTIGIP